MSKGIQFDPPGGARFEPPSTGRSPAWAYRAGAGVASLLLASALIVTTSRAAFNTTTDNVGNSINAGDVILTDDATATRFAINDMEPGESLTRCIVVTYDGSVDPSPVKMYSGGYTQTPVAAVIDDWLNIEVNEGTGGSFADCALPSAFVEDDPLAEFGETVGQRSLTYLDATHDGYGNGFGDWNPSASGQSKTYQITVELDAAAPNTVQNQSVTDLIFTWEVVN